MDRINGEERLQDEVNDLDDEDQVQIAMLGIDRNIAGDQIEPNFDDPDTPVTYIYYDDCWRLIVCGFERVGFGMGDLESTESIPNATLEELELQEVKAIMFYGCGALLGLPQDIWNTFTNISLELYEDNLSDHLDKMANVHSLYIYTDFPVNYTEIVAAMDSLTNLSIDAPPNYEIDSTVSSMMALKSHRGRGIKCLDFNHIRITPFHLYSLCRYAKFAEEFAELGSFCVVGRLREFTSMIINYGGLIIVRDFDDNQLFLRRGRFRLCLTLMFTESIHQ